MTKLHEEKIQWMVIAIENDKHTCARNIVIDAEDSVLYSFIDLM